MWMWSWLSGVSTGFLVWDFSWKYSCRFRLGVLYIIIIMNSSSSLAGLSDSLDRSAKRSLTCQQQIFSILNSLIGVIEKAQEDVSTLSSPSALDIKSRLLKLHSSIAQLKPIANLSRIHQEMYARISKLRKEMERVFEDTRKTGSAKDNCFPELDAKLLELAIVEHFLKENSLDAAAVLNTEFQRRELFERGIVMHGEVRRGVFKSAIEWAETERLYETFGNEIEFELRKREFLQFAEKNQVTEAISYCRSHLGKFVDRKMKSIQELMGFLLFSDSDMEFSQRYQKLKQMVGNYDSISKQLLQVYYEHHGISQLNSLDLCLRAGLRGEAFFQQGKMLPEHREVLPFSVDMPEYKYHSMFVCPVTKEVSSPGDKPIVLRCGHVISEYSFNRIVDNRTKLKFKCPVCHTEQKLTDVVEMRF